MKENHEAKMKRFFRIPGTVMLSIMLMIAVPAMGQDKPPIKIGVILPLSGGWSLFGTQGMQGVKMAAAEINDAGGLLDGRKIELVVEDDDQTDPLTCGIKAIKLIREDKVMAIVGPISTAGCKAMIPQITRFKVPLLYATDYQGGICNRYVFCYGFLPDQYISPFVPYLKENYGSSFYLFGTDFLWSREMNLVIKQAIAEVKGSLSGEEYTPFNVQDFGPVIGRIKNSGAKVLMLSVPGKDGQQFIKQFTNAGLKDRVKLVCIGGGTEQDINDMSVQESEGIVGNAHYMSTLDRPETQDFVRRQKEMFGPETTVTLYADSHYGLLKMFAQAIQKAGVDDIEKIIDAMVGQRVVAGNGEVTMNPDHHVTLNMIIFEVRNGRMELLKYLGPIRAADQCEGQTMIR